MTGFPDALTEKTGTVAAFPNALPGLRSGIGYQVRIVVRAAQGCDADFRRTCGSEGFPARRERGACGQYVVDEQDMKPGHPFRVRHAENSLNVARTHVRPDAGLRPSVLFPT